MVEQKTKLISTPSRFGMKNKSNILKLAIFATGISGVVAEYILSTLATYFLGNSTLQWTMILSIMLFSMGIGSRISKLIKSDLLFTFIIIEFVLSALVGFTSLFVYTSSIYSELIVVVIYSLCIVIGLLIGMEIPLVMRINEDFQSLKSNVSSILENDYYGSLIGGIFFAFVGLPYLGLTYTPFVLGLVNFSVANLLIILLWNKTKTRTKRKIIISSLFVATLLITGIIVANPIVKYGEQKKYKDTIVFSKQSKYQKIIITQFKNFYWLYLNGNQQLSSFDEELYHEPLVHPVMKLHKHPEDILILGGGDGCAAREILKYSTVKSITLVDLDPAITDIGQHNPILLKMNKNSLNNKKVKVLNEDGYTYIDNTISFYDIIMIDLPDPKTIELSRLYSYEFYKKCYKHLRKNGIIITQAGSPYFAPNAFYCINKTITEAGFATAPLHNQVVTLGEWGWILGAKNISKKNLKKELHKLKFDDLETKWINHEAMQLITSFGKNFFKNGVDSIRINTIHEPVLTKYYRNGSWDMY